MTTVFILCRDVTEWQIVEGVHATMEGAKRKAQEIANGEYMELIEHDIEDAIITPAVKWHKPVDFPGNVLYGQAYEAGSFAAEFILRTFEIKD